MHGVSSLSRPFVKNDAAIGHEWVNRVANVACSFNLRPKTSGDWFSILFLLPGAGTGSTTAPSGAPWAALEFVGSTTGRPCCSPAVLGKDTLSSSSAAAGACEAAGRFMPLPLPLWAEFALDGSWTAFHPFKVFLPDLCSLWWLWVICLCATQNPCYGKVVGKWNHRLLHSM